MAQMWKETEVHTDLSNALQILGETPTDYEDSGQIGEFLEKARRDVWDLIADLDLV